MNRPDAHGQDGRVRVPADVERPDRILAGLTARQLAILAGAAVVLWAGYAATRQLLPVAAYAALAVPLAAAAVGLALGRIEGVGADRFLLAALAHRHSARRLVPTTAPSGVPAPPAIAAGPGGPAPDALRLPFASVGHGGVVNLGGDGAAMICRARSVAFSLRTPAEQEAMVAGFARFLNSLAEPVQVLVRSEPINLDPAVAALAEAGPALPHPALEDAATDHAAFLAELSGRGLLSRQVLVVLRQPPHPKLTVEDTKERLARRASEAATALAGAGVALEVLDADAAATLLARAADPAATHPVVPSSDDIPVTAAPDTAAGAEGDLW
ncbi:MAG TPA: PrgI family protein [Acidimicrobiales bacterium]|nr:PrgI family protein [Acidimicrobiales bacterium]